MVAPKIAIVLGSKFPTEKAYGITTLYTINSILMKSKSVKIFCLKSDYQDIDFKRVGKYISHLRMRFKTDFFISYSFKSTKIYNRISFRIGLIIILIDNLKLLKNYNPEIFWIRDPFIGFFICNFFPRSKIILEIHSSDSILFLKYLVRFSNQIFFFPINAANQIVINKIGPDIKSILAPMAVDTKNFPSSDEVNYSLSKLIDKRMRNLHIGYVGNVAPQGYSKGIEDLILLANLNQDLKNLNEVVIVGCTDSQIKYYSNLQVELNISTSYLKFLPHVNHTAALKIMRNFDILVLPMPFDTSYNGMPLKLLEYLASGKLVIMAESDLLKPIFGSQFTPYWYNPGDASNLYESITIAIQDENLQNNIHLGLEFAQKFTWETRTNSILKSLNVEL